MSIKRWLLVAGFAVALFGLATACSSGDNNKATATASATSSTSAATSEPQTATASATPSTSAATSEPQTATASATPSASAATSEPQTVTVTLTEFGIESSVSAFHVGTPYHFVVTNQGKVPHELMIVQPIAPGMMSMTEMDNMAVAHVEEDDLPTGATYALDFTFDHPYAAGELEFACHIAGHYEAGMLAPMTVE